MTMCVSRDWLYLHWKLAMTERAGENNMVLTLDSKEYVEVLEKASFSPSTHWSMKLVLPGLTAWDWFRKAQFWSVKSYDIVWMRDQNGQEKMRF